MLTKARLSPHDLCCWRPARSAKWQTRVHCHERHLAVVCYSQQADQAAQPISLPLKPGHCQVYLFGVEHNFQQVEPAKFILEHRPAAVVFENSFSASGGNSAVVKCTDPASLDGSEMVTMACAYAERMRLSPGPVFQHVWQQLQRECETEMLAHMAAFVTNTTVVHGDRPKSKTYERLNGLTTLTDLDEAIAAQVCINFTDALGTSCGHTDLSSAAVVHQIFTAERDQVLCHSLQHSSLRHQQSSLRQLDCVLGVVGVAHIPGIIRCWKAEIGNSMAGVNKELLVPHLHQTAVPVEDAEAQGVRRALLETFLGLSCSPAVCADMQRHLPALPPEAEEAYACARELYGSPRMLLAALPREHLDKACSSWNCDMWKELGPLRDVRPMCGGPGYDWQLVMQLRQLYFDLG